jgi:predicted NBD/HSP70 family sugar kinase
VDLATFQWLAGGAMAVIIGLVGYIARETNEKLRDLRQEIKEAKAENERLREALDSKADALHTRINNQVATSNAQSVTLAGFQGTFMTREEHARHCQQHQHQPRG